MREVRDLEEQVRPGGGRGAQAGQRTACQCIPREAVGPDSLWLESQPCSLVIVCVAYSEPQLMP